jgi:spore germination protein GerM
MGRRRAIVAALTIAALAGVWMLWVTVPHWYGRKSAAVSGTAVAPAAAAERKITATLYYVSQDGLSLVGVQREVPFGDPILEQARHILEAQLTEAPPPLATAIPVGTKLRGLFLGERGEAFVDLTGDVRTKHGGGALDEIFTVYVIVDALTVNLPSITRVQILIDGKEADTLAGHVDLRHPLQKNMRWAADSLPQKITEPDKPPTAPEPPR